MKIATATHTQTKLTRLVDVLETTPERIAVSWTLGQRVEFDAVTKSGLGPVRDWVLAKVQDPDDDMIRRCKARPRSPSQGSRELSAWLIANNMTQGHLAALLRVETSTVNKWIHFKVRPQRIAVNRLHTVTGIKPEAWEE